MPNNRRNLRNRVAVVPPFQAEVNEDLGESAQPDASGQQEAPTIEMLKWRLRSDHRREIKNFHAISDLTRSIANAFQNDNKNRQLAYNLNHELRLRSTIDHHVWRLNNSQRSNEISSALNEVHERKRCFDEQYAFVNEAVHFGQTEIIYPDQLLHLSFERQRIIYKHIFKNNYPSQSLHFNENARRLLDEAIPRHREQHDEVEDPSMTSSSDSDDQMPALVPAERNNAPPPEPPQQMPQEPPLQQARGKRTKNKKNVAKKGAPARSSASSQQDDEEKSEGTSRDADQLPGDSLFSPGCSKWKKRRSP